MVWNAGGVSDLLPSRVQIYQVLANSYFGQDQPPLRSGNKKHGKKGLRK
jgi:hypothetical protein